MLKRLTRLLGMAAQPGPPPPVHDPVYGLPRRAVEEWLARNPRLKQEYEAGLSGREPVRDGGRPPAPALDSGVASHPSPDGRPVTGQGERRRREHLHAV